MKIEIAKQDLEATLQQVNPSLGGSGTVDDISVHYLFRAVETDAGWGVEVLTCHSAMFSTAPLISAVVEVPEGSPRKFTVEGKRLKRWLGAAPDEALTLEFDPGESVVRVSPPALTLTSVDPSKFRLWDSLVEDAKPKGTVKASRLSHAFNFAQEFVGSDDRHRPYLSVFEARGGRLMATDGVAGAAISLPGIDDAGFRVYGKDASKFVSFLDTAAEDDDIEMAEHPRAFILRKPDGAIMGERKWRDGFPKDLSFGDSEDSDAHWWELPVAETQRAIRALTAGADWSDSRLRLVRQDDVVVLSMEMTTGKPALIEIEGVQHGEVDGAEPLPDKGVLVSHFALSKVLKLHPEGTIRLGFNRHKKSGYVRYLFQKDEVTFHLVITWLKDSA